MYTHFIPLKHTRWAIIRSFARSKIQTDRELHIVSPVYACSTRLPAILKTCKQIYDETKTLLWANTFYVAIPSALLAIMAKTDPATLTLIKGIVLRVAPAWDLEAFLRVLDDLFEKVTGLRWLCLEFNEWGAPCAEDLDSRGDSQDDFDTRDPKWPRWDDNPEVKVVLCRFRSLDCMVLTGYYLFSWLVYLKEKTGA